jgi:uncharacterized protein YggU (UPF0235/DUF167 family)
VTLVARRLEVASRSVKIASGAASRLKKIDIDGDGDRLADLCIQLFVSGATGRAGSIAP